MKLKKDNNKIIAIIPARGGSKRIPKKNIIDFDGKPLIAWTIEAAKETGIFDKIVVSTDSQEIADVAKHYGAEVPFLRDVAADDYSPVSKATVATLKQINAVEDYDIVIQLFAVCPLRDENDIKKAYSHFKEQKKPFLISCFKFVWMNPWWAIKLDNANKAEWIFEKTKKRSQDLPELFSPTGAIWIGNITELLKTEDFYGKGHVFWEMNWKNAVDIDNYEDLELAKALKVVKANGEEKL